MYPKGKPLFYVGVDLYTCQKAGGYLTACYDDGVFETSTGKYILWCTEGGSAVTKPDCPATVTTINANTMACDDSSKTLVVCRNKVSAELPSCQSSS